MLDAQLWTLPWCPSFTALRVAAYYERRSALHFGAHATASDAGFTSVWHASPPGCRLASRCPSPSCARRQRLRLGSRAERRAAAAAAAQPAAGPPPAASAPQPAPRTPCERKGLRTGGAGQAAVARTAARNEAALPCRRPPPPERGCVRAGHSNSAQRRKPCLLDQLALLHLPHVRRYRCFKLTQRSPASVAVAVPQTKALGRVKARRATHAASCAGGATPRAFASAALSSKKPAGKAPLTLARFAGGSSPRAAAGLSLSAAAGAGGAGTARGAGGMGAAVARGATGSCGTAAGKDGSCCAALLRAAPAAGRAAPLSRASALARNSAWSFALSMQEENGSAKQRAAQKTADDDHVKQRAAQLRKRRSRRAAQHGRSVRFVAHTVRYSVQ